MKNIQNNVQLVGRLGANPEVKVLNNGSKLARFTMAVNNSYTNSKGEKVTDVQWHNITAWGALAGVVEKLLQKGTQVTIDGKLNSRSYINRDGIRVNTTDVVINEVFVMQNRVAA